MTWDGNERRTHPMECKFENKVIQMSEDITETKGEIRLLSNRINGSIQTFYDHIEQGKGWRLAVVGSVVMVIINILLFSYLFGMVNKTVIVNERIIQRILLKYEQINTER